MALITSADKKEHFECWQFLYSFQKEKHLYQLRYEPAEDAPEEWKWTGQCIVCIGIYFPANKLSVWTRWSKAPGESLKLFSDNQLFINFGEGKRDPKYEDLWFDSPLTIQDAERLAKSSALELDFSQPSRFKSVDPLPSIIPFSNLGLREGITAYQDFAETLSNA